MTWRSGSIAAASSSSSCLTGAGTGGQGGSGRGGLAATFVDVAAGLHAAAGAGDVDLSSVVALGHSAAGHLAAWAADRMQLVPAGAPGAGSTVALNRVICACWAPATAARSRRGLGVGRRRSAAGRVRPLSTRTATRWSDPMRHAPGCLCGWSARTPAATMLHSISQSPARRHFCGHAAGWLGKFHRNRRLSSSR